MALIETLTFRAASERVGPHRPVRCSYFTFESEGKRYLQIDTYGSEERQKVGSMSQTFQLDARSAQELMEILRRTFPNGQPE